MYKRIVCSSFLFVFILIALFSLKIFPVFAGGNPSTITTADGIDCSDNCLAFPQSHSWVIDKFGKYILTTQARTGPTTHFAFSNDGSTWTQNSEDYTSLASGSIAYDSKNDVLHVIWNASAATTGIIYRRYSITRDGSNNITDILAMDSGKIGRASCRERV